MASIAPAQRAHINNDRLFFTSAALALLLATFIGFVPTYYLAPLFNAPPLSPLVHLHGVLFTAWILLFVAQTGLISAKRSDIHRIVGPFGAALGALVLILGIVVAIESGRHGGGPPNRNQPVFLVFPLTNILLFGGFCAAGIAARYRPQHHKRLMLIATLALVVTPLARVSRMLELPFSPPAIGGMLMSNAMLIALATYDVRSKGRLHPVTLWGGGLYLLTQPTRIALGQTQAWQNFAHMLIG